MSIRFKFRSAASYDAVEIGEQRDSITVKELKAKIIRQKNLNLCQDFDLLFSDAGSGQEYNDEDFQIPSGASVVIKRVPAGMKTSPVAPVDKVESVTLRDSNFFSPASGQVDNFDDFGADLCPLPDATFPGYDLESDKKNSRTNEKADLVGSRSGPQKLESSDLSQAIHKETGSIENEKIRELPQGPRVEEPRKLEKFKNLASHCTDMPSELKCSLCNKFFKDAVMIPCCQHSFCEKCIHLVLVKEARCPKCSSSKFQVQDLLPNLSLRQAIEHFLESQMLIDGSENDLCKYVPDGESGIQAIDVSCAVTVVQREPELPHSPTATGKGSNQILSESFYNSLMRKNTSFGGSDYHASNFGGGRAMNSAPLNKAKQIDRGRGRYAHNLQDEADSTVHNKRVTQVEMGGGDWRPLSAGRYNKGDRTCFMCGSPDHFIRDCPVATNPHPMLQTGNCHPGGGMPNYTSPYWNATSYPPFGPFGNMYGNPGMMPYNSSMVPAAQFAVPPYIPAMYGGLPVPGYRGNMGMGSMAPLVGNGAERPVSCSKYMELHHHGKRTNLSNEHQERERRSNDVDDFRGHYHFNEAERSDEFNNRQREPSESYSHDSSGQRLRKKHRHEKYNNSNSHVIDERHEKSFRSSIAGRYQRPHPSERSNSDIEHNPGRSGRHSDEEHKHHNRSSKKLHERRGPSGSDPSWSRHEGQKEVKRVEHDVRGSNHKKRSYSGSGLEPSTHSDRRSKDKERDSGHDSRRSKQSVKRTSDERKDDRRQMASHSDEDHKDNDRHHKRKRVH